MLHDTLPCGVEYGFLELPDRHIASIRFAVLAGACAEPADKLGLARILAETLDKGTENYTGRELSDAFNAIGTAARLSTGRETTALSCTVLPQHFERAVELLAEIMRRPTFPQDAFEVNIDLSLQELEALDDDPQSLIDKYIAEKAYGGLLGRHPLGEEKTLRAIEIEDLKAHWQQQFFAGNTLAAVAGPLNQDDVTNTLQKYFDGFGSAERSHRDPFEVTFGSGDFHYNKKLEQEQISICWPGVDVNHDDFYVQKIVVALLSGGMSARLFTEVREKQGLVYWVGAWDETPRGSGMLFLGASTTPDRCKQTYETLLREVERLSEDIDEQELQRAKTGLLATSETRGDGTRARCSELAGDLFQRGKLVPREQKLERIKVVTIDDIKRYLITWPREPRCVVTLGPAALHDSAS